MNSVDVTGPQWEGFERAYQSGRLAHAYILAGAPRGHADAFAGAILRCLYGATDDQHPVARRLEEQAHPDVRWVKPRSKSRRIAVNDIRNLITLFQQSALEGGWKVGLIYYADRLTDQAANALLKTLEEPLGRALLLLLTAEPQALLPTIRSRCQTIVLASVGYDLNPEQLAAVLSIMRDHVGLHPVGALRVADALDILLKTIRAELAEELERDETETSKEFDARVAAAEREVRAEIMKVVYHWQRDLLYTVLGVQDGNRLHFPDEQVTLRAQADGLPLRIALQRVAAVEEMARRLERNVTARAVFDAGCLRQVSSRRK